MTAGRHPTATPRGSVYLGAAGRIEGCLPRTVAGRTDGPWPGGREITAVIGSRHNSRKSSQKESDARLTEAAGRPASVAVLILATCRCPVWVFGLILATFVAVGLELLVPEL